MQDVGTLGGYNSWGRDINNSSQVVGESDTDPDQTGGYNLTRAFLWQDGTMTDLGAFYEAGPVKLLVGVMGSTFYPGLARGLHRMPTCPIQLCGDDGFLATGLCVRPVNGTETCPKTPNDLSPCPSLTRPSACRTCSPTGALRRGKKSLLPLLPLLPSFLF
jgi:probable HAF family extracellular repeat protein